LGAGGLEFNNQTSNSGVRNSLFTDISGAAIQVGNYQDVLETNEDLHMHHIDIVNNEIINVATELHANAGISAGYTRQMTIESNTLKDLTYSGISVGWGWSRENITYAADNVVRKNKVFNYKLQGDFPLSRLGDGGGIYFLGPQMNGLCEENYLKDLGRSGGGGMLYVASERV